MRKIALAVAFSGSVAFGGSVVLGISACGTPAVLQCRAEAVKFLPKDPGQVTPYDVVDLVGRLQACEAPAAADLADAGAP